MVHLAADQSEPAYREFNEALKCWPMENYHLQHWWALIARLEIDFYCDRGLNAWLEVSEAWGRLRLSFPPASSIYRNPVAAPARQS